MPGIDGKDAEMRMRISYKLCACASLREKNQGNPGNYMITSLYVVYFDKIIGLCHCPIWDPGKELGLYSKTLFTERFGTEGEE